MAAVTNHSDFRAQEEETCHCFQLSPFYLLWSNKARCHDPSFFLIFSFKPVLTYSSFTLIERLFSSSSLSAIRVVLSAYLRLLIFLTPILISAGNSSSPAVLVLSSAYRLNEQGDSGQPCHTPFSILNQSVVPYRVLTVPSWLVSQETGKMVWYSHLFKSFPQFIMIHSQRLWHSQWNRGKYFFLEFPNFLYNPANVGNLISGSSSFSKLTLDIWMFLVHIMLKPSMQDFKHDLTNMGDECNWSNG